EPDEGKPHVRFDEGRLARAARARTSRLLHVRSLAARIGDENPLYAPYRSLSDRLLDDQLPVRRELTAKPLALCPALSVTLVRLSQLEAATGLAGIRHPGGSSPKRRKGMPTRKPAVLFAVLAALLLAVLAACTGSQTPSAPKANASSSGTPTDSPSAP